MSENDGPGPPLSGRHRGVGSTGYRRVIGVHRAPGHPGPARGYLFTVALLAGTASMPIVAAISAGSATVGGTTPPNAGTPFLPTPSLGPVVVGPPGPASPTVVPVPSRSAGRVPSAVPVGSGSPSVSERPDVPPDRPTPSKPAPTRPTVAPTPPTPAPTESPDPGQEPPPTPEPTPTPSSTCAEPAGSTCSPDPVEPTPSPVPAPSSAPGGTVTLGDHRGGPASAVR